MKRKDSGSCSQMTPIMQIPYYYLVREKENQDQRKNGKKTKNT